jgi:hypothetical protein
LYIKTSFMISDDNAEDIVSICKSNLRRNPKYLESGHWRKAYWKYQGLKHQFLMHCAKFSITSSFSLGKTLNSGPQLVRQRLYHLSKAPILQSLYDVRETFKFLYQLEPNCKKHQIKKLLFLILHILTTESS